MCYNYNMCQYCVKYGSKIGKYMYEQQRIYELRNMKDEYSEQQKKQQSNDLQESIKRRLDKN